MCRYKAIICSRTNKVEFYRNGKCIGVTVAVENPKGIRKKIKKVIERMLARKRWLNVDLTARDCLSMIIYGKHVKSETTLPTSNYHMILLNWFYLTNWLINLSCKASFEEIGRDYNRI